MEKQATLLGVKNHSNQDFVLHVLLVMRQDGLKKSEATFQAWLEGPDGLATREK